MQKQTKIKMNDTDSTKLGGRRAHSFEAGGGGQVAPTASPGSNEMPSFNLETD